MNDMRIPPGLLTGAPAREAGRDPGRNERSATRDFDRLMDNALQSEAAPAARDNAPEHTRLRASQRPTPLNGEQRQPEQPPAPPRGSGPQREPQRADEGAPRRGTAPGAPRAGDTEPSDPGESAIGHRHDSARPAERDGAAATDAATTPTGSGDKPLSSQATADTATALPAPPVAAPNLPIDQILRELQAATAALAAASDALVDPGGISAAVAAPTVAALPTDAPPGTSAAAPPSGAAPLQADAGPPAGHGKTLNAEARVPAADAQTQLPGAELQPAGTLRLPDGALARATAASAMAAPATPAADIAAAASTADPGDTGALRFDPALPAGAEISPERSSRDRLLEDFERRFERSLAAAAGRPDGFTPGVQQALAAGVTAAGFAPGAGAAAAYGTAHVGIAATVGQPAFTEELSHRVLLFAGQRVHNAELSLTPADLGPIKVAIEIHGQEASLAFTAQHAATRTAIEDALPRLREMFAGQGLQLTQAQVGDQSRQDPGRPGSGQAGRDRNLAALGSPERSSAVGAPVAGAAASDARSLRIIDIHV